MLVGSRAGTLNAGLDLGKELVTLLAVAGKVGESCAAVAGKGTDEAGKLIGVSMNLLGVKATWNIVNLQRTGGCCQAERWQQRPRR